MASVQIYLFYKVKKYWIFVSSSIKGIKHKFEQMNYHCDDTTTFRHEVLQSHYCTNLKQIQR